mmetsp:Transcript_5362/g.7906  ORF Transcript_5362/g.7906 Transcript_5362/m.7906 type:complete len:455 (+) Transcript_5362:30-1394(+)
MKKERPAYKIKPESLEFIQEPKAFYEKLISNIKEAKEIISITSLYIGVGEKKGKGILKAIKEQLKKEDTLHVHMLFDKSRAMRTKTDYIAEKIEKWRQTLTKKQQKRICISYYSPEIQSIVWRTMAGERMKEVFGVQHIKFYRTDEKCIISGANLSDIYFDERTDRYIQIENEQALITFYQTVVFMVTQLAGYEYKEQKMKAIEKLPTPFEKWMEEDFKHQMRNEKKEDETLAEQLHAFWKAMAKKGDAIMREGETIAYPTLQMGYRGVNYEVDTIETLFKESKGPIYIASGYFNMTNQVSALLKKYQKEVHVVTSHPEMNGFYGSKGFSGWIPTVYAAAATDFMENHASCKHHALYEYYKKKPVTFHAKGIWTPNSTFIGSSNLGYRSKCRDLEASLVLHTTNDTLQHSITNERQQLFLPTKKIQATHYLNNPFVNVNRIIRWITRSFLRSIL